MKYLLKKIALIIPIVAIVAAFVMPGISQADLSLKNITITKPVITTRTATSITLESTLTYVTSNPSYNKQFKVANKDINFLYRKNNGSENKVPLTVSNAKTIYYDTPIKINTTLNNMDPNATYQGSFSEDTTTPDTKSTAVNFWVDTVSFSGGKVTIEQDPYKPGKFMAIPFVDVIFKNSSIHSTTLVSNLSLGASLYITNLNTLEDDRDPFTAVDNFNYNKQYSPVQFRPWGELEPDTVYKFIFKEKVRNALSTAFNFTTPALPITSGTTGSSGSSTGSSPTPGTSSTIPGNTSSNTTNNPSTTTTSAVGTLQTSTAAATTATAAGFSATFSAKPEYVVNYSNKIDAVRVNGTIKYTSTTTQTSLSTAGAGKVIIELLDKNNYVKYIDEINITGTSSLKRDVEIPLNSNLLAISNNIDTDVEPIPIFNQSDAPFKIRITDYGMDAKSTLFSVAMPTVNTSNNSGINTTITTSLSPADKQQFTASSERYSGITMTGSVTPTVEGGDLSIEGTLTYTYNTVPISDIIKGGSLSFQLVDGQGNSSETITRKIVSSSELTEYNKPYFFNTTFDNYLTFKDNKGKSVTTDRTGPFSLIITDDKLGIKTEKITVVDIITSGTMSAISSNGGMSDDDTNTNTINNGNGLTTTKIDFTAPTIDSPTETSVAISAQVTYTNKSKSGSVAAADSNIVLQVVDDSGKTAYTSGKLPITATYGTPATVSNTATGLSKDKKYSARFISNPGNKQILSAAIPLAANADGKMAVDTGASGTEARTTTPGLLRNPLRKGLDSIPDIVEALVANIVVPIAMPFLALSIIYTGFLFIKARGNPAELTKAKEALKWTLIGGAIILGAYVIAKALQGTITDILK